MKNVTWTPELAYGIGLLTTDGSLSKDRRHISFTTKDYEQAQNFKKVFQLSNIIGQKSAYKAGIKDYYVVQFGNVQLYRWLEEIGLSPNKTKTIESLEIPDEFFFDFLRGHLDGDGTIYSYYDPRWPQSFLVYTTFISASEKHIMWINEMIGRLLGIYGKVGFYSSTYRVRYAKINSVNLLHAIYYDNSLICLSRKKDKAKKALSVISCRGGEMEDASA